MSEVEKVIEWRSRNVYRDRKYENLVAILVENKETAIFQYNKDLMVFAAMIGYCYGAKKTLSSDKIQISLGTYASSEDDGFIYLLALVNKRNATCLKDANLQEAIKIFEEYCNGGLDLINDWFNTVQGRADLLKLDTLESKLLEQLESIREKPDNSSLNVEF